jgi:endonuclease/exonuclease/phosphatase (EEP) superfamily protein YafD
MKILAITLLVLGWIMIVAIALPFVKNDYWIFRVLEYPRLQKFIVSVLVLFGLLFLVKLENRSALITTILLGIGVLYLAYKIFPYTPFAAKEMKAVAGAQQQNQLKIFTANVYQYNDQHNKVLQQIKDENPDIIMLLETDSVWAKAMAGLKKDYPNTLLEPRSNTYGMLFYSRLDITEGAIKYLVEEDVPSLEATIRLPSGKLVKAFGLHPKPPVPTEDTHSTAKDKEIMKIAFKAKNEKLPVIVMGDLNDVAWSYVTELFRKTSGLLDPRRGRGFYSTFSAKHWYMRFPLDYVFCSSHFGLVELKRLNHNGSDHFAMSSNFQLQPELQNIQKKPKADEEVIEEAAEKAKQPA